MILFKTQQTGKVAQLYCHTILPAPQGNSETSETWIQDLTPHADSPRCLLWQREPATSGSLEAGRIPLGHKEVSYRAQQVAQ